jgi:hypothetical protein
LADGGHVPGVPAGPICVFSDPVQPLCGGDGAGGCDGAGSLVPGERNELLSGGAVRCGPSGQRRAGAAAAHPVEYDRCPSSHTVALPDGTYCYCSLEVDRPFREFLPYAAAEQERVKAAPTLEDGEDGESLFFVSCVPWLSYTALTQPTPTPADSNPRITWGRWHRQEGRTLLPMTLLANHALVDGIHIARFYENLDRELAALCGGEKTEY